MLRLDLLGSAALLRDGVAVAGRAAQRHRLALLALLARAPGHRLGRDKLIALLWPESDADGGRNLLKVATYVVRSSLGEGLLLSSGDELRLAADQLVVDATEFERAADAGDHATAVRLHRGPFMDGFHLGGARELEHWIERERDRLAARYRASLERLAEAAEAEGDAGVAAEWWRARATSDPYDSRVATRLMHALDRAGNRAGAIHHGDLHQRLLGVELGAGPSPEVASLLQQLRSTPVPSAPAVPPVLPRVLPPVLPVSRAGDAPDVAIADRASVPPPAAPGPVSGERPRRRLRIALAAAIAAVLLAAASVYAARSRGTGTGSGGAVAVLPFVDLSPGGDQAHFSDGLTEEVIARLAAVEGLKVISRTSAMRYKGSPKHLQDIANELGVSHVLEGSVRRDGTRVRISAQLIDARDDAHVWAESYERDAADVFRVQEEIARQVARMLELRLRSNAGILRSRGTRDPEAYDLYQRGRFLWNMRTAEGHARAIGYYREAIARDPEYADAYAALAHAYLTGFQLNLLPLSEAETFRELRAAADRAVALDPQSADAHTALALTLKWQQDWPGAAREFERALALNPSHASAHSWYGLLLRGMGRGRAALEESRRAAELDPFGVVVAHNYGFQCYLERDDACALAQFHRAREVTPYPGAWRGTGIVHSHAGRHAEARAALERAVALAPNRPEFVADLAYVLARAGRRDEARAVLARAIADPREPYNVGRAWIAFGEPDSAFAWLERANWKWSHRAVRDDPALDPIRADPRFARLSARVEREMGLPGRR